MIISKTVFTFLSVYTPQASRPDAQKEHFYDQLQYAVAKVSATEILILVGDWNGHVGAAAGAFSDAHGRQGFETHKTEGETVLEYAIANGLHVSNPKFKKRDTYHVTKALVAIQSSKTTHVIERVSAAQSAKWKSSLMRCASNNITWYCATSPLLPSVWGKANLHLAPTPESSGNQLQIASWPSR